MPRRRDDALRADVIVVGAGAAGCALAARLGAHRRVLLVEAGPWQVDPMLEIPMGFVRTMGRPRFSYRYATTPDTSTDAVTVPAETWLRGRGVGGSMLINGTMYLRGEPHLYDALAGDLGPHWSWPAFRSAFEHVEERLPVRAPLGTRSDLVHAMADAVVETGAARTNDVRTSSGPRVGELPATIGRRGRLTAAALLRPPDAAGPTGPRAGARARRSAWDENGGRRAGLRVVAGQRAERIVLEDGRAVGVQVVTRDGRRLVHRARDQVVLTAGALETPLLLERSGIGDPDRLRDAGIRPVVASPRVGEGLREQRNATLKVRLPPGLGLNEKLSSRRGFAAAVARYLISRTGPLDGPPYDLGASIDSTGGRHPDLQLLLGEISTDGSGLAPAEHAGLTIQAFALAPHSVGSVHARGPGADEPPELRPPGPDDPRDRALAARAFEAARAVARAPALAGLVVEEEFPADAVPPGDEDAAADVVGATGAGIYHAVGTCAAGGPGAVVDERLRVRGVERLRVADLSVLPSHTSGGTAAVAMALGHLAGGWLADDLATPG